MTVDPSERELLAQFLSVAIVRLDRALEQERFVETVDLFLNHLRRSLCLCDLVAHRCLPRLPDLEH